LEGGLRLPSATDIAAIRKKTGLSQADFARRISVPLAQIRNWEQGRRLPQGPARVLLALLDRNPRIVEETLTRWMLRLTDSVCPAAGHRALEGTPR
jgi:putative transcriptional regulator